MTMIELAIAATAAAPIFLVLADASAGGVRMNAKARNGHFRSAAVVIIVLTHLFAPGQPETTRGILFTGDMLKVAHISALNYRARFGWVEHRKF
jgi:hypothetical protein